MARPKGSLNKKTAEKLAQIEATGELPMDYMLRIMRDETQPSERRDDMAKSSAPYVHAKLANVDAKLSGKDGGAITFSWLPPQG